MVVVARVKVNTPDESVDPIVCSFPGGLPEPLQNRETPTSATTTATQQQQLPKFLWQGASVMGKDEACLYTASAASAAAAGKGGAGKDEQQRTKLCVGVYDTQTGTLTLHQAACSGTVFCLQQHVPAYQSDVRSARSLGNSSGDNDAGAQYRALFADFGSAKKKKVLKSQDANKVTVDDYSGNQRTAVVLNPATMSASNRKAVLEQQQRAAEAAAAAAGGNNDAAGAGNNRSSATTNMDDAVEAATMAWRQTFLPKFNLAAETPASVYSAADIAGHDAWGYISRMVTACWHKDGDTVKALCNDTAKDTWSESVKQLLLDKIPSNSSNNATTPKETVKAIQHKLKCAVLLNNYVGLYAELNRKRFIPAPTERNRFFGRPLSVAERFLESFCTRTVDDESGEAGYAMSKANKDSCVVHMLLLYMMVDCASGGITGTAVKADDVKPLADDLKVEAKDVMHLLRQAGCTVKRNGAKIAASLTTPLTFPKSKKGAGPKR